MKIQVGGAYYLKDKSIAPSLLIMD